MTATYVGVIEFRVTAAVQVEAGSANEAIQKLVHQVERCMENHEFFTKAFPEMTSIKLEGPDIKDFN